MKIKDYKCKCGHNDFFFVDKDNQKGIYCTYCGKWLKWADKDEQNLDMKQESKTGHWIKTPRVVMGEGYMWYCDKCEYQVYQDTSRNYPSEKYCPNCGAKMMESEDKEQKHD